MLKIKKFYTEKYFLLSLTRIFYKNVYDNLTKLHNVDKNIFNENTILCIYKYSFRENTENIFSLTNSKFI